MPLPFVAAIFDQDNTLVDSERLWPLLDGRFFPTIIGEDGWKQWRPEWLTMRADHVPMDEMLALLKERFALVLPVEKIKSDRERVMFDIYRENTLKPLPGAKDILHYLHARGIPIAVASGMNLPIVEFVNSLMGWKQYIRATASTHEGEKRNKPHPDVYLRAAERLGVDPTQCAAFENEWKGYLAATAAGMSCYLVKDPFFEERNSISEVEAAKNGVRVYGSLVEVLKDFQGD